MKRKILLIALLSLFVSSCEMGGSAGDISQNSDSESTSSSRTSTSIDKNGKLIRLEYSGSGSDRALNEALFEDFKAARKAAGDPNTYMITYLEHTPERISNDILNWTVGPDIYEFISDKAVELYAQGSLSKIVGNNATFIENNINRIGKDLATFNGSYHAYPYTVDNTYYVQYDTSFFTAEDVKSIETMLDKAQAAGKKVGYNLGEAFWGGAAMFTFGADYNMTFDADGDITNISADFNSNKGLKAAKAIKKIMEHPAWDNTTEVPHSRNNLVACIAGTWDIATYKSVLGNNYGAAVMPTVTIDGDTQHLGAFLGGKLFGINPQRAGKDTDRLVAAHELAKYLSGKEAQLKRFDVNGIAPCNIEAAREERVTSDPNVKVLIEQSEFAHAQTAVPMNFWTGGYKMLGDFKTGLIKTESDLIEAINEFNESILQSESY